MAREFQQNEIPQINIIGWTNTLRKVWEFAPTLTAANYVLAVLRNQFTSIANLRAAIKRPSTNRILRVWDRNLSTYRERLERYRFAAEFGAQAPQHADQVAIIEADVIKPILYGDYSAHIPPEEGIEWPFFLHPHVPDAMTGPMLFNQLIQAIAAEEDLEPSVAAHLGCVVVGIPTGLILVCVTSWVVKQPEEWFQEAERQVLEHSAPGEDPTLRDKAEEAIDEAIDTEALRDLIESLQKLGKTARDLGAGTLVLIGGLALVFGGAYAYQRYQDALRF